MTNNNRDRNSRNTGSSRRNSGNNRRRAKAPVRGPLAGVFVVIFVVIIIAIMLVARFVSPSKDKADLNEYYNITSENSVIVVCNNETSELKGLIEDGYVYVDQEDVRNSINRRFYYNQQENLLTYVTASGVLKANVGESTYTIGSEEDTTDYVILKQVDGRAYLALDFVAEYTGLRYEFYEEPNRVVISTSSSDTLYSIRKSTQVRVRGGIKSEILTEIGVGSYVTVLEELDDWAKVCTEDGFVGYILKNTMDEAENFTYEFDYNDEKLAHHLKDEIINLGWHQVTNQAANGRVASYLNQASGMNVISPTWFSVKDNDGNITSLANETYVQTCHNRGVDVWGLVSNLEVEGVDIAQVLSATESRENLINQLIGQALACGMDGINVDFEALSSDVGDSFIEFIRELGVKCSYNNLVLSVDNYVPSAYTQLYDREEQAAFADYVILMAYDEHFAGGEEGSVSSINYVTQGVADTLEEVPAEQLVLALPFYTRVWETSPEGELSSTAMGMTAVDELLSQYDVERVWDEETGQYYVEYAESDRIETVEETAVEETDEEIVDVDNADDSSMDATADNTGGADDDASAEVTADDASTDAAGTDVTVDDAGTDAAGTDVTVDDAETTTSVTVNEKEGYTYKIWLEESQSLEKKIQVYKDNNLAGLAFWKLGFEDSDIWTMIKSYID